VGREGRRGQHLASVVPSHAHVWSRLCPLSCAAGAVFCCPVLCSLPSCGLRLPTEQQQQQQPNTGRGTKQGAGHTHTHTHRSTIPTLTVHRAPRACALFRLPQWPSPFRCALTRRAARPQGPEAPAMPLRTECKLQGKHTQREKHTGPNLECTRPGWNRSRCPSLRVRLVHRSPLVRLPVLRFSFFVVW
jgi:hypothetical protein